ncbi:hypothetical protein DUNSADRAFT_10956 [Dunaliella salina]|nr:hypothetical protein DUNSADRAFT_10956 [Dunaliella salina]|eukprot:KAF5832970.1 hypothetical protein DUNSADRAFT_10956 [Dunaliella salina]
MRQYRTDKRNDSKETAPKKMRSSLGDSTSDDDTLSGPLVETEADAEAARSLQGFIGLPQPLGGYSSQWQLNPTASLLRGSKRPRGIGTQCLMMLAEEVRSGEAGPEPRSRRQQQQPQQLQSPFAQPQPQTRLPPTFATAAPLGLGGQPAPAMVGADLGGWHLLGAYPQQQQAFTAADLAKAQALLSQQHQEQHQQQQVLGMGSQHSANLSLLEQLQQQQQQQQQQQHQQRQHSMLSSSMHNSLLSAMPSASISLMHPPSCALSTCLPPLPAQLTPSDAGLCGGQPTLEISTHPAASAAANSPKAEQGTPDAKGLSANITAAPAAAAAAAAATPAVHAGQKGGQLCEDDKPAVPIPHTLKAQPPSPLASLAQAGSCDSSEATHARLEPKSNEMEAVSGRLAATPVQQLQQQQQQQQQDPQHLQQQQQQQQQQQLLPHYQPQHLQLVYGHGGASASMDYSLPLQNLLQQQQQQQQQQQGVCAPLALGLPPPPTAAAPPQPAAATLQVVQHGGVLYLVSAEPLLQQQQQQQHQQTMLQPFTMSAIAHAPAPFLHPATAATAPITLPASATSPITLPASAAAAAAVPFLGHAQASTLLPQLLPPISGGVPLSTDASLLSPLPYHGAHLHQGPLPAGHLLHPLPQLQPQLL